MRPFLCRFNDDPTVFAINNAAVQGARSILDHVSMPLFRPDIHPSAQTASGQHLFDNTLRSSQAGYPDALIYTTITGGLRYLANHMTLLAHMIPAYRPIMGASDAPHISSDDTDKTSEHKKSLLNKCQSDFVAV